MGKGLATSVCAPGMEKRSGTRVAPEMTTGKEGTGIIDRTVETVSETVVGAAEGLKHGTHVLVSPLTGAGESVKESARQTIHEASSAPTPANPSVFDRAKEGMRMSEDEAALGARQTLHETLHGEVVNPQPPSMGARLKEATRARAHEMTSEPSPSNPSITDQIKESMAPE